jgi:hypothetical protein
MVEGGRVLLVLCFLPLFYLSPPPSSSPDALTGSQRFRRSTPDLDLTFDAYDYLGSCCYFR